MKSFKLKNLKNYVNYMAVGLVLIVFTILALTGGAKGTTTSLLEEMSIKIILAVSLSLVVGFLGELSLGHAGFTMLSDLLVYAEKAQLYSGYKTDMLVTEGLEGIMTPSSFTSIDASVNKQQISGTVDSNVKWRSAGLVYQNAMALYIKFTATDIEGLEVRITRNGKTYIYTQDMFTLGTDGRYTILHQGIYFTQFDDDVTATFHRNGEQIGETLTYSVNSYIYRNQDAPDEKLCELLRATYVYGESAKAYKNK